MIISWEKIRHQHTKEEWKRLLGEVDSSVVPGKRGSSHTFPEKYRMHWEVGITSLVLHKPN
ncbi:hypothetical protein LEP1GSC060_2356 [Leptospira weilii serovar Ranarum str. ICFT]|uniref:Uncharacterized protein n=1 Tax=Leptospira weilii serovar Ranarum str. ICFT TaxID=1218598 RepID=N1WUJ8_9LEPT|nr:hypothetical protein LEP1GSC060_2356 [Leptospira weilii serovar Ranarum str. ICFT]